MLISAIFPGRYVQGYDALKRLGKEILRFGKKGLIICDSYIYETKLKNFIPDVEKDIKVDVIKFGGECCDEEIKKNSEEAQKYQSDVIVGIGGGKTLDTAKMIANALKLSVVTCPTIASTDAPTSSCSIIYSPNGVFLRAEIFPKNPDLVLVDTRVIIEAPVRFLVSGMGDALSTYFEAESCRRSYAKNIFTNMNNTVTAFAVARACYNTIKEYGVLAKVSNESGAVTRAFEHVVEANILMSGLGFESGGLASPHSINDGLTVFPRAHGAMHGEKVAIGVLTSLFLTDKPKAMVDEVYSFCESVGLPTTLEDIGLTEMTDEELMKAAVVSCDPNRFVPNESIPIEPSDVVHALKAMDGEGRRRKALGKPGMVKR